jgi:putative endonuclease
MKKESYIYILTNQYSTTFYIGVTSDLIKRVYEHKGKFVEEFSKKYDLNKLVYYEVADNIESAILREKQLKRWHRQWKINLIKNFNPTFEDLYSKII